MGFFDFFRRKEKIHMLEAHNNRENDTEQDIEEMPKIQIKVFPQKNDSKMEYSIEMFAGQEKITKVGNITNLQELDGIATLKNVAKEIEDAITPIETARNSYALSRAKEAAKMTLQSINKEEIEFLLNDDVISYIDNYEPKELLNYEDLARLDRKIDITGLSNQEIVKIGKQLEDRLNVLNKIKTPEDAYNDKENLIYYMQAREQSSANPIIEANMQSIEEGKTLDKDTVIRISKNMEQLNNEDGSLYSAYLKIEEKRVWKKIERILKKDLVHSNNSQSYEGLWKDIRALNNYQIKDIEGGFSAEILEYMIDELKQKDIENYTNLAKDADMRLAQRLTSDFGNTPEKIQILQFLHARIGSLGQLSKGTSGKHKVLRDYVANTDFKDEDITESKQFLLLVCNVEKQYIEKEYSQIIDLYKQGEIEENKEKHEKNTFKENLFVTTTPLKSQTISTKSNIDKEEIR